MKTNRKTNASLSPAGTTNLLDRPNLMDLQGKVREAHRTFPSGVTVVTACLDGAPVGLAVNAFSSVSMEPPMVLVCVNSSSQSHAALTKSAHLGINILSNTQKEVAMTFAKSGGEKFSALSWHPGTHGAPVLDGAAATFEVEVKQLIQAGTHTIFLGQVVDVEISPGQHPMVYSAGAFYDGSLLSEI